MIRILPPHVANKIAAGEVIERPASVVKELVENALDADATRITVELEEGGKRLIRVSDDGVGMTPEDLALAFVPHATSKIETVDDLFRIASLGFRGEALASIGSVARASIFSRLRRQPIGNRVTCERSEIGEVREAGGPEGTVVEVRDLFCTTPARRKFLKSDAAEVARITEMMTRLALPNHEVAFTVSHNDRRVLECRADESMAARIVRFFGRDLDGRLVAVSGARPGLDVSGWVALPDAARRSTRQQYLFLNGRFIRDKSLAHAVTQAYQGFLLPRRYPAFFLSLTIDPKAVDVNVHPTKVEVRFRDRNTVFGTVLASVRDALEASRPSKRWTGSAVREADVASGADLVAEAPEGLTDAGAAEAAPRRSIQSRLRAMEGALEGPSRQSHARSVAAGSSMAPQRGCSVGPRTTPLVDVSERRFMQIHDSYILVEDEHGLAIIDQHALHERMLFEKLMAQAEQSAIASQRLLVPAVIDVSLAEKQRLLAMASELAETGFCIVEYSGNAIAIEAVPLDLARCDPRRLVEAALAIDEERVTTGFDDVRRALLAGMACRAAVKFNDRLRDDEIRALLEWEAASPASAACPHGRPTRLAISLAELERQFQRKD